MLKFVDNYLEPITLSEGETAASLALPDGEYVLTMADSQSGATRWEIVRAVVTSGAAELTRGQQGTTDQAWPAGSVIYCALTADILNGMLSWLNELDGAVGAHEAAPDPHPQYTTADEAAAAAPVQSVQGRAGDVVIVKADVGLGSVDNTSDMAKPVSTAQAAALALKVNTSDVLDQLESADATKPLSANQGRVLKQLIDNIQTLLESDNINLDSLQEVVDFIEQNREDLQNLGISNIAGLQAALDSKAATNGDYVNLRARATTADDVGLDQVDNTPDALKPVSSAQQTALDDKVDKVAGKGLSTEDYTTAEKNKLAALAAVASSGNAADLAVADAGGYYTSANVEGALQEVGVMMGDVSAALDAINGEVV